MTDTASRMAGWKSCLPALAGKRQTFRKEPSMQLPCITVYQTSEGKPYTVEESSVSFDGNTLANPQSVYELAVNLRLTCRAQEAVLAIFCDTHLKPHSYTEIARGSVNSSIVPIREIIQCALLSQAAANNVILVHNHPSGDTSPSQEDITVTKQMQNALSLMNMHLQDHIIVSPSSYMSIKEIMTP